LETGGVPFLRRLARLSNRVRRGGSNDQGTLWAHGRPFEYLVCEKLMNFANAASRHPDFMRELPRFVSEVRRMFTPDVIGAHLE
jgi:hypothetical protein